MPLALWFRIRRRTAPSGGSALVEFALTATFMMFVVFFIWEMVMLMYTYNVVAGAAKEGVRYAIVHGSGNTAPCTEPCVGTCASGSACVQSVVQMYAQYSFHDVSGMTVNVTYPDGSAQTPNRVRVEVSYPYQPIVDLGWEPPVVNAAAEGRITN